MFNAQNSPEVLSFNPIFNFQKFGSEDGLNNATIFNISQHPNGKLFFTTQNGIYNYDGYTFNKLEFNNINANSILGASIKNDKEIFLSISNEGIIDFNLNGNNFHSLNKIKVKDNNAEDFIVDSNFAYLLTWSIKLTTVDLLSKKIIQDEIKQKDKSNLVYCLFKTKSGKVFVGRTNGLYQLIKGKQILIDATKNKSIHAISEAKNGDLYLGGINKIYRYTNKIEEEITPKLPVKNNAFLMGGENSIDKITIDNYNRIWFTTSPNENLFLYQNNMVYNVFELLGLPPTLINYLYKDANENIWIGTFNDGVYYIQNTFFSTLNFKYSNKGLSVNQTLFNNKSIYVATNNGFFNLDLVTYKSKILSKPDDIFNESISTISQSGNTFYYSKRNEFDLNTSIFHEKNCAYKIKPILAKLFVTIDSTRAVMADWNANVLLFDLQKNKVIDPLISFLDYKITVNSIFLKQENLLIATNKGLYNYNMITRVNSLFKNTELNFNCNDIVEIENKIWVAHEAGITELQSNKQIQEIGNLKLNTVKKIKQHKNLIWIATLDGLIICNKNFEPLKVICKTNGLPSNSINDISFSDSLVFISTARGLAYASLDEVVQLSSKLKSISSVKLMYSGEVIPISNESKKEIYNLTDEMEMVNVSFISPFYNKPNKQFFRWNKNNGEWNYTTNSNFDLTLDGGLHQIKISASIDNIVWSDEVIININKKEKLSETQVWYWLITLFSISTILLISFLWTRRVKQIARRRLQDEQQINLLKHQAMNSLLSPHFIFNSLTSIQNYINTNNGLMASEYLAKFSRLIRMIIEKASHSQISLHDELTRLTYYLDLEKERFKNKFDYKINLDERIDAKELMLPNMIIQPHVENCIIHGILPKNEHGWLHISFNSISSKKFEVIIEDNGIGINKAKEHAKAGHKSLGTSTIENILEINSKLSGKRQTVSITDKSEISSNETGTIIKIEIEI